MALLALLGWRLLRDREDRPGHEAFQVQTMDPPSLEAAPALPTFSDLRSSFLHYPEPDTLVWKGRLYAADYAPDTALTRRVLEYLRRHRPEYAVVLVCDLASGHILAAGERRDSVETAAPSMAFASGFPAASLSKIVTALAALETGIPNVQNGLPHVGAFHTLYRRQLAADTTNAWRMLTLKEAFARSVNPAFGILGQELGAERLRAFAEKLGFNRKWPLPLISRSRYQAPDTGFGLAEHASGFTRAVTISPYHALCIARGLGHDGRLLPCRFAAGLRDLDSGREVPLEPERPLREPSFASPANLARMQALMEATVELGTARRGFRRMLRRSLLEELVIGGKTGSLDGEKPPGRYDWFIGYARFRHRPEIGIAVCTMLIHQTYRSLGAPEITALIVRDWAAAARREEAAGPSSPGGPQG